MNKYRVFIKKYSIFANAYVLYLHIVETENIYEWVGKYYLTSMEKIISIQYCKCLNGFNYEEYKKLVEETYGYKQISYGLFVDEQRTYDIYGDPIKKPTGENDE